LDYEWENLKINLDIFNFHVNFVHQTVKFRVKNEL